MSQTKRILIGVAIIIVIVGGVLAADAIQRKQRAAAFESLPPGAIPIYVEDEFQDGFIPDDLSELEGASFVDDEEGKTQEGWMLRNILGLYINVNDLKPGSTIRVSSSSREKSIDIPWSDVDNPDNMVMFDLSGRGTLKLVSKTLENFSTRDEWIQDVDKIEVFP